MQFIKFRLYMKSGEQLHQSALEEIMRIKFWGFVLCDVIVI